MPGALLYLIPFFKGARVSSRYTLYAALFLILLAAWGLAELLRRCPRRAGRWALTAAALCVTAIEFYPGPLPTQAIGPRPVDRWLAEQPPGGVLELPLAACRRGQATLATLTHGKPLLGASNGTPQWFRLHAIVARLPEQEALGELQRLGLRYLLLHTEDDATIRLLGDLESAGLIRRDAPGDIIVLELPLGP